MGGSKRMMQEDEKKRDIATQIALEAGVLKQCSYHYGCIYKGDEKTENAYILANHQFSHGEHINVFKDRREMTDLIQVVVSDYAGDECQICARISDD